MNRRDLLPGVAAAAEPPAVVCDARAAIRKARRRAIAVDLLQVALLLAVDYLFISFPSTHVPGLERGESLTLLRLMNVAVFAHLWLQRALPRWTARRIAGTWCRSEQRRFFDADFQR